MELSTDLANPTVALIAGMAAGMAAVLAALGVRWLAARQRTVRTRGQADRITADAEREAEQILKAGELDLQEKRLEMKAALDQETWTRKQELDELERRLTRAEEEMTARSAESETRLRDLGRHEEQAAVRDATVESQARQVEALLARQRERLEQLSGLTVDEAKVALKQQLERDAKQEMAQRLRQIEADLHEQADKKAQHIITTAIERCAVDTTFESTVVVVSLPGEDMKGRIIGRDGRNIQALQAVTGVDVVVDDTPGVVLISSFDPVRRTVARWTLERLIADGRIQPARIEEVHAKAQAEIQEHIQGAGEEALLELGVHDVHPEIVGMLGRLQFRTSYGQNVLNHSKEVAHLCGMMASEYGLDESTARRAGLLHDIGKAISHEAGGAHALIGGEVAERCGESAIVVNAIAAHHHETEQTSLYSVLAEVGDAISAARPGARREQMATYLSRLSELEKIAEGMPGVDRAYAVQAGRELRVIANAELTADADLLQLSRDIAHAIEAQLDYPGRIRVTCIRESRAVEYAM